MNETKTKRQSGKGLLIAQISVVLILTLLIVGYFVLLSTSQNEYAIYDGGQVTYLSSKSTEINEILAEAGIPVGASDRISTELRGNLTEITIQRQNNITVALAGDRIEAATYSATVGEALRDLDIALAEQDMMVSDGVSLSPADPVYDGMDISITQNSELTVTETVTIPYDSVTFLDPTLAEGVTTVKTPGSNGQQEVTTLQKYVNGELVSSTVLSSRLVSAPVSEVVLVGSGEPQGSESEAAVITEPEEDDEALEDPEEEPEASSESDYEESDPEDPSEYDTPYEPEDEWEPEDDYEYEDEEDYYYYEDEDEADNDFYEEPAYSEPSYSGNSITTSSGEVLYYSDSFTVEATAYTGGGTTATGTPARYGAIAVDPDVIPYGTRMYIVSNDGNWIYGVATAEDCGGAINGYIIDLYFDDYYTCIQFGRRNCTVYILD